jgi:hypothetical protein
MSLTRANRRYMLGEARIGFLMQGPTDVVCEITLEALYQLGRARGLTEPTEIFETSRDVIERLASEKYDRTSRHPYEVVTITTDDLEP